MTLTDAPTENEIDLADPSSVKQAIAGEQPDITPPEDPMVELPRGIWYEGAWQTKVELHELTGEDEERFTRFKDDELFVSILTSGVSRIGTVELDDKSQPEQEEIIQSLLVGEQMILLTNIIRVTFGNERELTWTCRNCESKNITTLLMAEDFKPKVPDGLRDEREFTDTKGHKINYVPVSGVHMSQITPGMAQGAVYSKLLEKVITKIDGDLPFDVSAFVKMMGMKDRRALLADLDAAQPVVNMNLPISCAVCGEEQITALTWAELFRL